MEYKIGFLPSVKVEIGNARDWYKKIDPELARRLNQEIHLSLNILVKHPNSYGIRYRSVRRYNLRKFPYFFHYIVDDKKSLIKIIGFYHELQHPDAWQKDI